MVFFVLHKNPAAFVSSRRSHIRHSGGSGIRHLYIWNLILSVAGIGCWITGVASYRRNRTVSHVFIHISTALSLIVCCMMLAATNL
ncbi:MAG: hypothetical protein ACOYJ5_09715 [Acutalibacteraceae bacterium]